MQIQGKSTLNNSKFIFSVSTNKIQITEFITTSFTESTFYVLCKICQRNEINSLEQNIRKQIDCKRPKSKKQMNRVQNIRIEIRKCKYNHVRLVLAVFDSNSLCKVSNKLYQASSM